MAFIRIQTTQNVTLEYEVASVGHRILATLIDWAIYAAWAWLMSIILAELHLMSQTVLMLLIMLPILTYPLLCEAIFNGATLGKHALKLRVVKRSGSRTTLSDYLLRWLLIPLDLFPFGGIGLLAMMVTPNAQRVGDMAAGTAVVKLRLRGLRESTFAATTIDENYQITYPQVTVLSDHDAVLIRRLLIAGRRRNDEKLLYQTARRVKELMGLQTNQSALEFLETVLRDHAHLAIVEAER